MFEKPTDGIVVMLVDILPALKDGDSRY